MIGPLKGWLSMSKTLLSPKLARYFKDYSSYHKTPGNKLTHYFGITFIVVSLLGLLGNWVVGPDGLTGIQYFRADGGTILMAVALFWYVLLDWKIALPFALVMSGMYFLGRSLPTQVNWIVFITGWVLQGVGHWVYEKNSPAFFKNLTHLLVGPLWIFARIVGYK